MMKTFKYPHAAALVLAAGGLFAGAAQADCSQAATSAAAASAAIVATANSNADGLGGLMSCLWPLMERATFQAAMIEASASIGSEPLAMLVIELGSNLLSADIVVNPDPTMTEPPASAS